MEGYLSEVRIFAGNFAPLYWAFCNGQLYSIQENSALFSLIGTSYGGDGVTTFAVPDLQSRVPIHTGQGPGLSNYVLGQTGGSETNTLIGSNINNHTHAVTGNAGVVSATGDGQAASAVNNFPANNGDTIYGSATDGSNMAPSSLSGITVTPQANGGNNPMNNLQPYLALNFIICVEGIFPSQN